MEKKLEIYADMLKEWQKKFNLVAPSTLSDIYTRHFEDSSQLSVILPGKNLEKENIEIIDLGSGAGFPGVILAMTGYNVTCIESIGKKAAFLIELKKKLDLPNLKIINDRVENVIKKLQKTGKTYIFTARAFAPLSKILDYVAPVNCRLFLLKGREIETEIADAARKYKFNYTLYPSKTGDGFMIKIDNIRPI